MQITLNKVPFDVRPVEAALRAALLADPMIRRAVVRPVWAWDHAARKGSYLLPVTAEQGVPVPMGLAAFVAKPGTNGAGPQKAEGPSARMAERVVEAVGAKDWGQVMQAVARTVGVPQKKVPFEAFAALNAKGSYQIRMETEFQVVELANAGRNLSAFVFLPGIVAFHHVLAEGVEDAPQPGSIRPAFVLPPGTQAGLAMRRLAVARRLNEMQAELGGERPADLPPTDPRRAAVAKLGAEWRALQPKNAPKAA
jgi:hypothetical protein